jgi:rod shape determining protein RodA
MLIDRRLLKHFDTVLLSLVLILLVVSCVILYSAGYDSDPRKISLFGFSFIVQSGTMFRQMCYGIFGLVVAFVMLWIPPSFWLRWAYLWYGGAVITLLLVLLVGVVVNGSRRWLPLGGFSLQPSELVKLSMVFLMARYISHNLPENRDGYRLKELIVPGILILLPMIFVMKQPDLGTALVIGGIGFLMLFITGIQKRILYVAVIVGIVGGVYSWNHLHDYQKNRILVLIDSNNDPLGSGYHILQSKIAIGSGQLVGKGYLQGTQSHLEFLPEHTTDFIFSVLGEEWGFVGSSVVILLYFILITRLLALASKVRDTGLSLVVLGITSMLAIHAIINIGMVLGIFPVVGIPLPLFSYGGSSLITLLSSIGIVLGIGMRRYG